MSVIKSLQLSNLTLNQACTWDFLDFQMSYTLFPFLFKKIFSIHYAINSRSFHAVTLQVIYRYVKVCLAFFSTTSAYQMSYRLHCFKKKKRKRKEGDIQYEYLHYFI